MSDETRPDLAEYEAVVAEQLEVMRAEMSPQEQASFDAAGRVMKAERERMEADRTWLADAITQRAEKFADAWAQVLAVAVDQETGEPRP